MSDKNLIEIKKSCMNIGVGMGYIGGVFLMLIIPRLAQATLNISYEYAVTISLLLILINGSLYFIYGLMIRKKLKEESNWNDN